MPRENSLTDSEGRSLTPELEEEESTTLPGLPNYSHVPEQTIPPRSDTLKTKARTKVSTIPRTVSGPMPPMERFRAAVRKVMAMQRGASLLGNVGGVGAEPGIDPRRPIVDAAYAHIKEQCQIEVVDYSAVRSTVRRMNNEQFVEFIGDLDSSDLPSRDPWVKVRWINIGGISWDVVKSLAVKYNLHPLALEDIFHGHSKTRSKADYYPQHLFLRLLCHELLDDEEKVSRASRTQYFAAPRSSSPEPLDGHSPDDEEEGIEEPDELEKPGKKPLLHVESLVRRYRQASLLPSTRHDLKASRLIGSRTQIASNLSALIMRDHAHQRSRKDREKDEIAIQALKQGSGIAVDVTPMFFFLLRDGTIISIRPIPHLNLTAPISFRLKSRDTVLRSSADPSLLLHALLDLVVDKAVQVVEAYHATIHKMELESLLSPQMATVRDLHILSGDLILHKRTLDPIRTLIYGLRRYDIDRCAALIDFSDPANKNVKVVGFMSHKAKIYLADVYDHMDYILSSLDIFAGIAQNLIDYSFNMSSYEMNDVMQVDNSFFDEKVSDSYPLPSRRRLTTATITCLPLTLLTGYFGMNFKPMPAVDNHSDLLFWEIAIPIMIIVVPLALWNDLEKFWRYVQKRAATKKAMKAGGYGISSSAPAPSLTYASKKKTP
ncbi:Cobalt/magnesium transport protein CorA [Psilocybe cubensis]|uniref:Cobalt/magnesium transport protein CorA n=2 Tax=Psilocybe cubensis TaxID=181762 RepID=A0ACB8GQ55_PSICU|nr:Cobalt/magnesium transport protein CorA [Psilocybe cubensis]KAH9477714.1 Cobalt/magnesium transport protein CorA [Psilocybe cubensis]